MVAVRMVSEGVDVPRLAVGVYATSSSTPLFFAQAIGRFVRARRRGETASVFLPNVPILMALASELERQRDHALDRRSGEGDDDPGLDDGLLEAANRDDRASDELEAEFTWQALGSDATFDRVLFDGTEFGTFAEPGSDEEHDFIGIPGILEPDQVAELLRHRQARQARRASDRRKHAAATEDGDAGADTPGPAEPVALYRTLKEQRSLLNSLVGLYARQNGQAHSLVHAELRRSCGGPEVAQATVTQLQARIELLRRRLSGR